MWQDTESTWSIAATGAPGHCARPLPWAPIPFVRNRRARLAACLSQTKPVVDFYAAKGLYSPIDANQKSDTVKGAISAILK